LQCTHRNVIQNFSRTSRRFKCQCHVDDRHSRVDVHVITMSMSISGCWIYNKGQNRPKFDVSRTQTSLKESRSDSIPRPGLHRRFDQRLKSRINASFPTLLQRKLANDSDNKNLLRYSRGHSEPRFRCEYYSSSSWWRNSQLITGCLWV
jgi:hypothetical protein